MQKFKSGFNFITLRDIDSPDIISSNVQPKYAMLFTFECCLNVACNASNITTRAMCYIYCK